MSGKERGGSSKFGLMDRLRRPEPEPAELSTSASADEPADSGEVKFTSYLDADIASRLQMHVARKKSQKKRGQGRVSIKSELQQALREYLERQGS